MRRRQWGAALWAAMTLPWAVRLSRCGWVGALLGAALAALLCLLLAGRQLRPDRGRLLNIIYGVGLALLGGLGAARSRMAFPQTGSCWFAGLGILALALWTAARGPTLLGRVCCVLLPVLGVLFGTVILAGLSQVEFRWLAPALRLQDLGAGILVGLYPCAALVLPGAERRGWLPALALPGAVFALLTAGTLSPEVVAAPGSLGLLVKSLSVFGVVSRFEALIYGALLWAYYAFSALLLTSAAALLPPVPTHKTDPVLPLLLPAGLGFALGTLKIGEEILLWGGLFCGVFATLTLLVVGQKKVSKN